MSSTLSRSNLGRATFALVCSLSVASAQTPDRKTIAQREAEREAAMEAAARAAKDAAQRDAIARELKLPPMVDSKATGSPSADAGKSRPGKSVSPGTGGRMIYIEDFATNVNQWWIGENESSWSQVSRGTYTIRFRGTGIYQAPCANMVCVETGSTFQIGAELRVLTPPPQLGLCGVGWELRTSTKDYLFFGISNLRTSVSGRTSAGSFPLRPLKSEPGQFHQLSVQGERDLARYAVDNGVPTPTPIVPFFGQTVQFLGSGPVEAEIRNLTISYSSEHVPRARTVECRGNFRGRVEFPTPKDGSRFRIDLPPVCEIKTKIRFIGPRVVVSARLQAGVDTGQSAAGVFLQMQTGECLRLLFRPASRAAPATPGGTVAFVLAHGNNVLKERQIEVPAGPIDLRIERQGDDFSGAVEVRGKRTTVGSLAWPQLTTQQEAGVIATRQGQESGAPELAVYQVEAFRVAIAPPQ